MKALPLGNLGTILVLVLGLAAPALAQAGRPEPRIDRIIFGEDTLDVLGGGFGTRPPDVTLAGNALEVLMHSDDLLVVGVPEGSEFVPGVYTLRVHPAGNRPLIAEAEITVNGDGGDEMELWFRTEGSPGAICLAGGHLLGIGTFSPQALLDVNGSARVAADLQARNLSASENVRAGWSVLIGPDALPAVTGVEALRILKGSVGIDHQGNLGTNGEGFTAVYRPPMSGGTRVGTVSGVSADGRTIFMSNATADIFAPIAADGRLYRVAAIVEIVTAIPPLEGAPPPLPTTVRGNRLTHPYTGTIGAEVRQHVTVWPEFAVTFTKPFSGDPVVTFSMMGNHSNGISGVPVLNATAPGGLAGFSAFIASTSSDPFHPGDTSMVGWKGGFNFIAVGGR